MVEGAVIVVSILLAFAIDAAWDRYEASVARAELIDALILDFETTGETLDAEIVHAASVVDRGKEMLGVIARRDVISKDSVRVLMGAFFSAIRFEPALASYETAVGENGLTSLESRAFLQADAEFRRARAFFNQHSIIGGNLFYRGPTLEIRRELGSLGVLEKEPTRCGESSSDLFPEDLYNCPYPEWFDLSAEEMLDYIGRPGIYGGLENIQNFMVNQLVNLHEMREATNEVLEVLRELDR